MLTPVVAALLYPLFLAAFHAGIVPVIAGKISPPAPRLAAAALALLLAFAMPIVALLDAMALGAIAKPSLAQSRARAAALLAVAAPPLFVFLGVLLYMLHDPLPDIWLWAAFWIGMAVLVVFSRNDRVVGAVAGAPAAAWLRVAHGMSALGIVAIFLALHLANHLTFILGPATYGAVMKAVRHVYRQEVLEPILVGLFLFQLGSGAYLAARAGAGQMDRFRVFQVASGIFLAAYVLAHMNSVFLFARFYLGIDTGWRFATGAPTGLLMDKWNIRLVPHYGLGVFFVLSHLAAGVRSVLLSHGVRRLLADRLMIGCATVAGLIAVVVMLGMCGARLSFAPL